MRNIDIKVLLYWAQKKGIYSSQIQIYVRTDGRIYYIIRNITTTYSTSGEFSFNSNSRTSTEELTDFGGNELRDFKYKSMKNEYMAVNLYSFCTDDMAK